MNNKIFLPFIYQAKKMALAEVFYAGVLLWTVAVWVGMLLCPHHPTLHRLLRTPHLVIAPHLILYLVLVLPPLFQGRSLLCTSNFALSFLSLSSPPPIFPFSKLSEEQGRCRYGRRRARGTTAA